jgi:hypothetical protein
MNILNAAAPDFSASLAHAFHPRRAALLRRVVKEPNRSFSSFPSHNDPAIRRPTAANGRPPFGQAGLHNSGHGGSSIDLTVRYHCTKAYNASNFVHNLSRFAIAFLKRSGRSKNKFRLLKDVVNNSLKHLGFQSRFGFSGRVYGAKKAASFVLGNGGPLNTLDAHIDYSQIMQKTRNGT